MRNLQIMIAYFELKKLVNNRVFRPRSKTTEARKCSLHKNTVCRKRHCLCPLRSLERAWRERGERKRGMGKRRERDRKTDAEEKRDEVVDYSVYL